MVIFLPGERYRFFCDRVQDGVVNLSSRNKAFCEMQRNGVERFVITILIWFYEPIRNSIRLIIICLIVYLAIKSF
ncbi:hypothetical protein GFO_0675 [Christiangramia forsetii KT0803]|uniref:Uncharacterized protein n=1 Tax=Christiangramia forsetii (strain DSM 17595 / CGMCC 1.15422 / KT0803) TaxID=411154 RepID=A0LZ57_CHRFK|nr:hypothetical protein GFO_0675 [Christiangramia forsetii KT0803]